MIGMLAVRSRRSVSSCSEASAITPATAVSGLQHCDAVLRLPGESTGADQDVAIARQLGLPVYQELAEVFTPLRAG
jgi:hypothetical protein